MSATLVRPVRRDDADAITAIYRDAVLTGTATFEIAPPDAPEMLRRLEAIVGGGYPYFVVERDGRVVGSGYAAAYRARAAYRWTVEDSIYLAGEVRGQGLGRRLLDALIGEAERCGFRQMIAVIGDSAHTASIRLHSAAGFREVGVMHDVGYKFGRWLDTVVMERALGPGGAEPPATPIPARRTA